MLNNAPVRYYTYKKTKCKTEKNYTLKLIFIIFTYLHRTIVHYVAIT